MKRQQQRIITQMETITPIMKMRNGQTLLQLKKGAVQAAYDEYEALALEKFKSKTGDRA